MHYPSARTRWWTRWRMRTCAVCGLRWPCADSVQDRIRARAEPNDHTGAWSAVYVSPYDQIGRAGRLTPAQLQRARAGESQ